MNYCSKCGKEIPDGENKLCSECKKSLFADLEKEEDKNLGNADKKKKSPKPKKKSNKNKKLKFILLTIFLIVFICFILEFSTNCFSKLILGNNEVGITIGNNNNNFGYINKQGKWIYYMTLSKDASKICINRIQDNGKNSETLVEKDWEIYSINVYKKYLYFIAFEEATDNETYQNNKIYKMSLDGKELKVINDNKFSDDCRSIYVVNDRIYYIGEDYNIYSMDLDGGDRKKVNNNQTGYIGITDKYIIYNDYPEKPESQTDYVTYIMGIDGKNSKAINGKRIYNPNIVGKFIYYVNGDNSEIHKIGIDGKNDTVIYKSPAYNMNVSGDYIYYLNYKNENADSEDEPVCIHRINLDGTDHKIICEMQNYSSFVGIAGDWVYYTDHDDKSYYINMMKNDGSDIVTLYNYQMNQAQSEYVNDKQNSKKENQNINTTTETNTISEKEDNNTKTSNTSKKNN